MSVSLIQDLETAFVELERRAEGVCGRYRFPESLEVFEGHFPDFPMVPGVYLIGAARHLLARAGEGSWDLARVVEAKFTGVVRPEEPVLVELAMERATQETRVRVQVHLNEARVARFDLVLEASSNV